MPEEIEMNNVQIPFEATSKDLNFISDPELAQIIKGVLFEIDNLTVVRAHRSMIYLSMSTLEGILSNVLGLNLAKIKALTSYPKKRGGTLKDFDDLVLADKIVLAKDLDIIAPEFYDTFKKFKEFRNYMHPLEELRRKHKLDIGLGQVALGLMNHTISKLERIRFIDEKIWKVESGIPLHVSGQKKLEFRFVGVSPTNSFLITDDYKSRDVQIKFDLHIGAEVVFNFVYNYETDEKFQMLRFDTRATEFSGLLNCAHKYGWQLVEQHKSKWVIKTSEPNQIELKLQAGLLKVYLNGNELLSGVTLSWDNQKAFGFFNEVNHVYISNLKII
jgi:hypothetical protein